MSLLEGLFFKQKFFLINTTFKRFNTAQRAVIYALLYTLPKFKVVMPPSLKLQEMEQYVL